MGTLALMLWSACFFQAAVDEKTAEKAVRSFNAFPRAKHSEEEYIEALNAMAETVHSRTLNRLAAIVGSSSEAPKVRIAAALKMGEMAPLKKQAAAALSGAYSSASQAPAVQLIILQALGMTKDSGALSCIHRAFEEKDPDLVRRAVASAGIIKHPNSVDAILTLLSRLEKQIQAAGDGPKPAPADGKPVDVDSLKETADACNKALAAITGQSFASSAAWQDWWNRNRSTIKPQ